MDPNSSPDGIFYFCKDGRRKELEDYLLEASDFELVKAVKDYQRWREDSWLTPLHDGVCYQVALRMLSESERVKPEHILRAYDIVCREIARRSLFKEKSSSA